MVLAVEPMVTAGRHMVRMGDDGWAIYSQDGSLAAHFEFTIAVTADGPRILTPWHLSKAASPRRPPARLGRPGRMMITDSSKRVIPFRERDAKRIGEGCFYLDSIVWLNGDRIELGDSVGFNVGCFINGFSGLIVGDGTNFGPYSMVHTANHNMEDTERPVTEQGWREEPPVRIGRNCWVGMGAMHPPGRADRRRRRDRRGLRRGARRRGLRGRRSGTRPRSSSRASDARPLPPAAAVRPGA